MATATGSKTVFNVPCPLCGATGDEGLTVVVGTLALTCQGCNEEVTLKELSRLILDAQRLVKWLEMAREV